MHISLNFCFNFDFSNSIPDTRVVWMIIFNVNKTGKSKAMWHRMQYTKTAFCNTKRKNRGTSQF